MFSFGNKVIVETYKKEALRSQEKHGFAFMDQKTKLKGLRILVDAHLVLNGQMFTVPKDHLAYVKEELLHTQPWAAKPLECDTLDQPFLIVDLNYVEFFD